MTATLDQKDKHHAFTFGLQVGQAARHEPMDMVLDT
jgi:hypothetical protein